ALVVEAWGGVPASWAVEERALLPISSSQFRAPRRCSSTCRRWNMSWASSSESFIAVISSIDIGNPSKKEDVVPSQSAPRRFYVLLEGQVYACGSRRFVTLFFGSYMLPSAPFFGPHFPLFLSKVPSIVIANKHSRFGSSAIASRSESSGSTLVAVRSWRR